MSETRQFDRILSAYYRKRYLESEDCLSDITKILSCSVPESTQINDILNRLVKHFSNGRER